MRLFLDGVAAFYLFSKNTNNKGHLHFLAVIKAHLNFYLLIPKMIGKRRNNLIKRKNYYNKNSILWLYYVRKLKTLKVFINKNNFI